MQSVYSNKENCCGCSACYSICPGQAITMKPDEEGFLYSEIDQSRCVDCHRCTAICPLTCEGNYKQNGMSRFYAAYHKAKDVLRQSTSGGAFTALSEKLYLCDVICYSIPSPLVWEDYKRFLERKDGGKLTSVRFRSKKNGWSRQSSSWLVFFTTDRTPEVQEDDLFYQLYLKTGAIIRPSCSQCRFTDVNRASDLTIADYWGICLRAIRCAATTMPI